MYSLNINNTNTIDNLQMYMLTSIENNSTTKLTECENNKLTNNEKQYVPRNNIYVNYNKMKSKYNEKPINNKVQLNDKLFWCFYKLYNKIEDEDLQYINLFTTEKNFKISVIDKINDNKALLKKHKIGKNSVESEITNNKQISLNSFKTLCILYDLNVIILKDNDRYTRFCNNDLKLESCINNLDDFYVIKLVSKNLLNSNYDILVNIDKNEIKNALTNYFYVKDLDKPLKCITSYKLDELIAIANKLNKIINKENNKKKIKIELYSECLKKIS